MPMSASTLSLSVVLLALRVALSNAGITYHFDMDNANSSIYEEIATSVREAVDYYNAHGLFNKHLNIQYNPSVPTADATFSGNIRFGGSRNTRVALHEIMHTIGIGTHDDYWRRMTNGTWDGPVTNAKLSEFDGAGSILNGDSQHVWPYGLNFDSEDGVVERYRHVQIAFAMQCDMGLQGGPCDVATLDGPDRRVTSRSAGLVWQAYGNVQGDPLQISDHDGADAQRWDVVAVGDNEFAFHTRQTGALVIDVFGGNTNETAKVGLSEWTGAPHQIFRVDTVPATTGWHVVRPLHALDKCLTATAAADVVLSACEAVREEQHWGVHI